MHRAIKIRTTVQPGGRIEVNTPDLPAGKPVKVTIEMEDASSSEGSSILDVLAGCEGGRLFKSVEEVDAYIREERDSWDP
jgi:hypothetical protein